MRRVAIANMLLWTVTTQQLQASANVWTSNGPEGGPILAIAIDPHTPTTVFAGTPVGLFRSTDAGANWQAAGRFNPYSVASVNTVAIDPVTPSTLYAGTSYPHYLAPLFKSTDAGDTWTITTLDSGVSAIAIDPTVPTTIYAAGGAFVDKSTNGGLTWLPTGDALGVGISALLIDPQTPATLYAATYATSSPPGRGIFKTTDGGIGWQSINNGLSTGPQFPDVEALAIDSMAPGSLYAGTAVGVSKSTDAGADWTSALATDTAVSALAVAAAAPPTLYAALDGGGLLRSTDAGGTWAASSSGLTSDDVTVLAIDPETPTTLYAGTSQAGMFKSPDAGNTWASTHRGLPKVAVGAVAVDPLAPGTVYAGASGTVFRSTDGGRSWNPFATGLGNGKVDDLVIDPLTPNTLYAGLLCSSFYGCTGGLFRSSDSGSTWMHLPNGKYGSLAVDPVTPSTLYLAADGVYKSTDSGDTWTTLNTGMATNWAFSITMDPSRPNIVYAPFNGPVLKTTDGGETWMATGPPHALVGSLAVDPTTPDTLYAVTALNPPFDVFKSTDGGTTWVTAEAGLENAGELGRIIVDPMTNAVYVNAATGVFRSIDGGRSWSPFGTGLPAGDTVHTLVLSAGRPGTLYVGMNACDGICRPAGTDTGGGIYSIDLGPMCVGDCDDSGQVTVDEILAMVNVALGIDPVTTCNAGDANQDGQITVDEILAAVDNALNGCASTQAEPHH